MSDHPWPKQNCAIPTSVPRSMPPNLAGPRILAIRLVGEKWQNGAELAFHFLEHDDWRWSEDQMNVVRWAFAMWKGLGIGLRFREEPVRNRATLRIGLLPKHSWSWVGREVLRSSKPDGRNMNFGWDLRTPWGQTTALHEIGHAIGMPHEHQNPNSGIEWNDEAVYAYYGQLEEPWTRAETYENVIRKLDPAAVAGSLWDPRSIMHYPTEPGLIERPEQLRINGTPANFQLSETDIAWVRYWYPPLGSATVIGSGEGMSLGAQMNSQSQFLIQPKVTREYIMQTSGAADTLITLAEDADGMELQLASSDDSGTPHNARIKARLEQGKRYVARVRTNFAEPGADLAFEVS